MEPYKAVVTLRGARENDGFFTRQFTLDAHNDSMLIGRSSSSKRTPERGEPHLANAFFACPIVSRRHARLSYANGKVDIKDLGSMHGTYVNGNKLQSDKAEHLHPNDTVTLGSTMLTGPQKFFAVIFRVEIHVYKHPLIDLSSPDPEPAAAAPATGPNDRATYSVPSSVSSEFEGPSDQDDFEEDIDPDTSSDILAQRSKSPTSEQSDVDSEPSDDKENHDHDAILIEDADEGCSMDEPLQMVDSVSDEGVKEPHPSGPVSDSSPFSFSPSPDADQNAFQPTSCANSMAAPMLSGTAIDSTSQGMPMTSFATMDVTHGPQTAFTFRPEGPAAMRMPEYHSFFPVHGLNAASVPHMDFHPAASVNTANEEADHFLDGYLNATSCRPVVRAMSGADGTREPPKKPHDPMAIDSIVSKMPEPAEEGSRALKRKHADEGIETEKFPVATSNEAQCDIAPEPITPESLFSDAANSTTGSSEPPSKKAKLHECNKVAKRAYKKRMGTRSKAANVMPFAFGAFAGGLAMLGALVFLPESVFF